MNENSNLMLKERKLEDVPSVASTTGWGLSKTVTMPLSDLVIFVEYFGCHSTDTMLVLCSESREPDFIGFYYMYEVRNAITNPPYRPDWSYLVEQMKSKVAASTNWGSNVSVTMALGDWIVMMEVMGETTIAQRTQFFKNNYSSAVGTQSPKYTYDMVVSFINAGYSTWSNLSTQVRNFL